MAAERQDMTEPRRSGRRFDGRRTLQALGISVNPPPPPERPARHDSATVTYPSATTHGDGNPGEGAAPLRSGRRSTPSLDPVPRLSAPVIGDLPTPAKPLRPGFYAAPRHRRRRPPNYLLRRLGVLAALVAIGVVSFASYSVATPSTTSTAVQTQDAGRHVAAARPPAGPKWFVLPPRAEPGGGTSLFPSHRLVAFYGAANNPKLGVLGDGPPDAMWSQLMAAAAPYQAPGVTVVPSYELDAFTAEASAGPDGSYTKMVPAAEIDQYRQVVDAHDGMLILDIQPGRSSFVDDAKALEPWLTDPHVGLALDPEWELQPGQLPGKQVGRTTADEINQVSAWLQQLTTTHDLPQKLLLVHQFQAQMIQNKANVAPRPNLSIAFNMDGFGPSQNKLTVYNLVASDGRWPLGYKLFYDKDNPMQTPQDVLGLQPQPAIIEYE